jgi:DNA-binding protein WhiA
VSFSQDVKRELDTVAPGTEHCRRAELAGVMFGAGTFEIASGGRYTVRASLALPATARRVLALLKPFGAVAELRTVDSPLIGRRYEVVLGGSEGDLHLLHELGVLSGTHALRTRVARRVVARRCCLVSFLRGMFMGCGSISMPGTPVHAEFTVESADLAEDLHTLLARLELQFSIAARARNIACYTKRGETAADLLAVLGAYDARLRWEEHLVLGRVRERANRLANCDQANARRAAEAGRRQVTAARRLMADPGWSSLSADVRDAARLRIKYPDLSLEELAVRARPPLTKSSLNHRLRRMMALADLSASALS